MRSGPRAVNVEPTTRCNMRCAMCLRTLQPGEPAADLPLAFFEKLCPAFAECARLVFGGLGEPLLHPELAAMIRLARTSLPATATVGVQTNGLLATEDLVRELVAAGLDEVCISVDEVDAGSGGTLHGGAQAGALAGAYARFREVSHELDRPVRLGAEFVLMRSTVGQLPAVVRWAGEQSVDFIIVSHVLAFDASCAGESLFNPNTERATDYYRRWRERIREAGLDIRDYPRILFKYAKSPDEKRLVAMVRDMQADARAGGVWLNIQRLIDWDAAEAQSGLGDILFEAQAEADRVGIELRLPPLFARHERSCSFVDEPAIFVDARGRVAPCHFLWRDFRCVVDGEAKEVRRMSFGSLADSDIEDIWNAERFRAFRSEAGAYDYPHCSNCNAGPCSDVAGPFERDCLGAEVPCGHCPWPVGQLACLH
jgi:putative metalloenzyme radical SAM/SPASM domain maturase